MTKRQSDRPKKGGKSNHVDDSTRQGSGREKSTPPRLDAQTLLSLAIILGGCIYGYRIGKEALLTTGVGLSDLAGIVFLTVYLVSHVWDLAQVHGSKAVSFIRRCAAYVIASTSILWRALVNLVGRAVSHFVALAKILRGKLVSFGRRVISYFDSTKILWGTLGVLLVAAGLAWVLMQSQRSDPEPQRVSSHTEKRGKPQKPEKPQEQPKPELPNLPKHITAGWPFPLATNGFENLAPRLVHGPTKTVIRRAKIRRTSKMALTLHPQQTNESDQNLTSYVRAGPTRYPCLSPFVWIMTPIEVVACGLAPLVLSPLGFPSQPPPPQLHPQPLRLSSDASIY